ncbi:GRAM domain-containing protein 2A isoform X2 [Hypomesus transpacificus]|uniref:GRAM domain-containing protein 2A isoform X2 n=1 Tax=Hypomesus transpacificus TaxID=137520 RepID=UPI001F07620E|nr:GRAM domain-containing protein 2A isoform X2 [Hypomesus transpacificus]XP_046890327.1 GRAM domain-containing protein 2A isoform X2 [Hypomesus transpacificus]
MLPGLNGEQVQLPVSQALPDCSQGGDPHESLLLCSPAGHPAAGASLHLTQLAVFLCQPVWEGHQVCVLLLQVAIPVVSVRLVKKHRTAGLVPNGLATTIDTSQKYVFVSLLSRDSVYDVLRRICTHLQVNGKKSLSLKLYLEEPSSLSMDEFPVVADFPPVLKWRRQPSVPSVSSSLPDLLGNSTSSLSTVDTPYPAEAPLTDRSLETEKILLTEAAPELGPLEYQLLKFFILLIVLLILSSCYLAFRVCSLEQQLAFLNTHSTLPLRER